MLEYSEPLAALLRARGIVRAHLTIDRRARDRLRHGGASSECDG
ncbi:MAG: hypothetical protein RML56_06055 [Burkholderiales bacterium]|nr:hypothetical protein [Burkholderiales bacterium]